MSLPPVERSASVPEAAQAEKMQALARFGGGVAHEFNNILHIMRSAVEMLRRTLPDANPDAARLLDMLVRSTDRAVRLTRELQGFTGGNRPERPQVFDAAAAIAAVAERMSQRFGDALAIAVASAPGVALVEADPQEFEQVLVEILSNASDAMPGAGRVTVEVSNATMPPAGAAGGARAEFVAIAVRDQGPGMTPETVSRAFDPYFTTRTGHAGLGLSRVYGFAMRMGGEVRLETAPGAGTTVTLYLPRVVREVEDAAASARPRRSVEGLRVLVVEDESLILMFAEDLLEQIGCRAVATASSIEKALELARSAQVDVAMLDVDVRGTPVYPVAHALQARGVPFVFMSGYGVLEPPWQTHPRLQKPFDVGTLREGLQRALEN